MRSLPKGSRFLPNGKIQVHLTYQGQFHSEVHPPDTADADIKKWRRDKRYELEHGITGEKDHVKFRVEAAKYKDLCSGMPSVADRHYHIDCWVKAFGDRYRSSLTPGDIRQQLEKWRKSGHKNGSGLTAASLNRRLTALQAMFTALDGKSARNIVKDVPKYDERGGHKDRSLPMLTISTIIGRVPLGSKSRARLRALQWTGWPASLVMGLQESDVRYDRQQVRVPARFKGQGMAAEWIKVTRRAIAAIRGMFKRKAGGTFSNSSLHSTWHLACDKAKTPRCRVYDIKHSFGAWAAPRVKDNDALKRLMRTNSIQRYVEGAAMARVEHAVDILDGRLHMQVFSKNRGDSRRPRERERTAKGPISRRKYA